jgi:hypothetical protein
MGAALLFREEARWSKRQFAHAILRIKTLTARPIRMYHTSYTN